MEIIDISQRIGLAMDVINALQAQVATNVKNISSGTNQVSRAKFSEILNLTEQKSDIQSVIRNNSNVFAADELSLPSEMVISRSLKGKYGLMVEVLNSQLSIYRVAVTGRNSQ